MVFLGIFHARQDNTGSPTKPRLFGSIQSIFKTTQSYAGDETTDRLLPAPKQRSQHWLKCCGSWRSWGSRRRAPAAAAYSVPCPGSCRNPSAGAGTSPPGPRARRGRAKADAGAGSAVPARIAQSITALRRRVLGLPAWVLSTLGRSTHRGKGEDYGK